MPYITKEDRVKFDNILNNLPDIKVKGELEYCIYKIMVRYMKNRDRRYSELHDTVYAAMHCADEYRRRNLDQREDRARETNGDIE